MADFPVIEVAPCAGAPAQSISQGVTEGVQATLGPQEIPQGWKAHVGAVAIVPSPRHRSAKRVLDVVIALLVLLFTLPFYPIIALAIHLESKGPTIYRQVRVGRNGRMFVLLKFRSMYHSSESADPVYREFVANWMAGIPVAGEKAQAIAAASALDRGRAGARGSSTWKRRAAPRFKLTDDPRITRVGRILRASSIDELPQFLNVLLGDMSVVGPRPAIPFEVERYKPRDFARMLVKPGITGLWQVFGRGNVPFREMITMDLDYVAHNSFWGDVGLILSTVPSVLRGRGAA